MPHTTEGPRRSPVAPVPVPVAVVVAMPAVPVPAVPTVMVVPVVIPAVVMATVVVMMTAVVVMTPADKDEGQRERNEGAESPGDSHDKLLRTGLGFAGRRIPTRAAVDDRYGMLDRIWPGRLEPE